MVPETPPCELISFAQQISNFNLNKRTESPALFECNPFSLTDPLKRLGDIHAKNVQVTAPHPLEFN